MCKNRIILKKPKKEEKKEVLSEIEYYQLKAAFRKKVSLIIVICCTITVIVITLLMVYTILPEGLSLIFNTLSALLTSAIAGSLVSYFVDMPNVIESFKVMIISAITSDKYITSLPKERLKEIREQATKLIHKEADRVPHGLLKIDSAMCNLLAEPYYSFYTENIVCHKKGQFEECRKLITGKDTSETGNQILGEFNEKDVSIEFEIVNPVGTNSVKASIGLKKSMNLPDCCDIKDIFAINCFELTIDNASPVVINPVVHFYRKGQASSSNPDTITYDTSLSMSSDLDSSVISQDNMSNFSKYDTPLSTTYNALNSDESKDLMVEFMERVRVKFSYKQILPNTDNHYTKRLRYSAKEYLLLYSNEDDVELHGQIFGTHLDQQKISIIKNDSKHITIQCRDWLLPGNGTFVVSDDKI